MPIYVKLHVFCQEHFMCILYIDVYCDLVPVAKLGHREFIALYLNWNWSGLSVFGLFFK